MARTRICPASDATGSGGHRSRGGYEDVAKRAGSSLTWRLGLREIDSEDVAQEAIARLLVALGPGKQVESQPACEKLPISNGSPGPAADLSGGGW
jgi:hypothetical protein